MTCEPSSLLQSARCFRCLPKPEVNAALIYTLCQWANNLAPAACQHDVVDDWVERVAAQGGTPVGAAMYEALCQFMTGLDADGLTPKIHSLNALVPGETSPATTAAELTRALVPLIKPAAVTDPWTNTGPFVPADLTVNGLQGNGSKYLRTKVIPGNVIASATSGGLTFYHRTNSAIAQCDYGVNGTGGSMTLNVAYAGNCQWDCWTNGGAGRLTFANPNSTGFISGDRIAGNDSRVYGANNANPVVTQLDGTLNNAAGTPPVAQDIWAFALNNGGAAVGPCNRQMSFFALHDGFTQAQCQMFYDRIVTLRTALGGGLI